MGIARYENTNSTVPQYYTARNMDNVEELDAWTYGILHCKDSPDSMDKTVRTQDEHGESGLSPYTTLSHLASVPLDSERVRKGKDGKPISKITRLALHSHQPLTTET